MNFILLSWKNMKRHLTKTMLTLLSIIISVGVLFTVVSYDRNFSQAMNRELEGTGLHITLVPTGCPHEAATLLLHGGAVPRVIEPDILGQIKNRMQNQAASLHPLLIIQGLNTNTDQADTVYGLARSTINEFKPGWRLEQGSFPIHDNELFLGFAAARQNGIQAGDTVTYLVQGSFKNTVNDEMFLSDMEYIIRNFDPGQGHPQSFRISGILSRTGTHDDGTVFAPLPTAYLIAGAMEGITALGIRLNAPNEAANVSRELENTFPGIQAVTSSHLLSTVADVVHSARILSFSMVGLVMIISISGIMNSILMTVYDRTREIGVMRAIGASRMDIFRVTIIESLILTFIGGIAGILTVLLTSPMLIKFIRQFMPYTPEGLTLGFDPLVALSCVAVSVITGILAGIYPAWKSSMISPMEAMRN